MYQRNKQTSQLQGDEYRQGQSTTNYYDSQSQQDISPQRRKEQSRNGPNRKTHNLGGKIQDVIQLCMSDQNEGANEFETIANAEKGILDMLLGSDLPEVHIPVATGTYQGGYSGTPGLASGYSGQGGYGGTANGYGSTAGGFANGYDGTATGGRGFPGDAQKGSKPFLDIDGQSPRNTQGHPSIRAHLNNQKIVLGDDAIEMIEEIEKKALVEIQQLRRERAELIRRLNEEIRMHNDQKRRRIWCENQMKKMMAFLEQQGVKVGAIQYPQWYFQSSADQQAPQQVNLQQTQQPYVIGGDQNQNQGLGQGTGQGFGQTAQSRLTQGQSQLPQQQFQPNAPSFARQNQTGGFDTQQAGHGQQNLQQSNLQYPQQPQYQGQSNPQQPNQASQHTNLNQSALNSQLGQSAYDPQGRPYTQQVQSAYQIPGQAPNAAYQQGAEGYQDGSYSQQRQGLSYNPQTGQYEAANNYGGLRNNLEQLRQENQNIRQNFNEMQGSDDIAGLQQRLIAAEQRAKSYEREVERWRLEASRKGDYPGLAQLLEETERIRQETIKLLRLKERNALGGQRSTYEDANYMSANESYNTRSRKQLPKGSFQTNALSPKNDYQHMLDEMKRITKG